MVTICSVLIRIKKKFRYQSLSHRFCPYYRKTLKLKFPCFKTEGILFVLKHFTFPPALLTANEHDTDGEDLLRVGVWRDVPKAHAGQAAEGEVQSGDILVLGGGA